MTDSTHTGRRMIGGRMVDVPMAAAGAIHRPEPEPEPVAPAVAELVELVEQNMGVDRLVVDAADFFTDPGGVLGYLLGPRDATDEDAREAFRVIARKYADSLDDSGEAARHYLATGQAWAGTLTVPPAPAADTERTAVTVKTTTDGERLRVYGPAGELLGEHFIGQASGAEWVGMLAATLVRVEYEHDGQQGGYTLAELAEQVVGELPRTLPRR